MTISPLDTIDIVRRSQDRFAGILENLPPDQVSAPSYDDEWSIADVASHLGSQAEIFGLFLDAGLEGTEPPTHDAFLTIWDRWNAKPPADQVADSVAANESLVSRIEDIPADDRGEFAVEMFGGTRDLGGLTAMRLSEHAVHTWDIAVALDPAVTVAPDAVELLIDTLPQRAAAAGLPVPGGRPVEVVTADPQRTYRLTLDPAVTLTPRDAVTPDAAVARFPAEAFLRLVAGRLDAEHTPLGVDAPDLDQLRQAFPGF
jgi:uncharacterized protein (TIGR03083 family)